MLNGYLVTAGIGSPSFWSYLASVIFCFGALFWRLLVFGAIIAVTAIKRVLIGVLEVAQ